MKKVTFKYENTYSGKTDTYVKDLDLEYQAGNSQLSDGMQRYNILVSLAFAFIDFLFKMGYSPELVSTAVSESALELTDLNEDSSIISEESIDEDLSTNEFDYDTFLNKFEEDEIFKQKVYQVYQLYMSNEN